MNLDAELQNTETPEDYATVMGRLRTTMETAAARTSDTTFVQHVHTLSGDFQQAADAVSAGEDPSSLAETLTGDGTQIDDDSAAAGYVP